MTKIYRTLLAAALAATLTALVAGGALAQLKGGGKIVCWKDNTGKVVGCGDSVPPEFQDSATKEMDSRGVTRKTTETAEERAKREALDRETAVQRAEEKKRVAEQSRQDAALINTFTNETEIDLKRDRDLQVVDTQLSQMRVQNKNAVDRIAEFKKRAQGADSKAGPSEYVKEELARAESDKVKTEQGVTAKEQEKEDIRKRYAAMKERYTLLRGGGTPAPTKVATPAAPAKK